MMDEYLLLPLLAGFGVAIMAGPLGCFIIWRRMAYFGDAISHSALLGVALAMASNINSSLAIFIIAVILAALLMWLEKTYPLSYDSHLGILAHSTLALGLVVIFLLPGRQIELSQWLFGDILAISAFDLVMIYGGTALTLLILRHIWRDLLADTISSELARAEGVNVEKARLIYMLLLAGLIALAIRIVGVLLITALLVIPAASARAWSCSPLSMAVGAALAAMLAVLGGLGASLYFDSPSGPSIVLAATIIFILSVLTRRSR
jgi:zinc transport system permease protein